MIADAAGHGHSLYSLYSIITLYTHVSQDDRNQERPFILTATPIKRNDAVQTVTMRSSCLSAAAW